MYATAVFGESFFLGRLLLLLLLLLLLVVVVLLLLAEACLANAESAGKLPLHNELSTRAPAWMSATKVVTGWMLSRAPVDGCPPLIRISINSSSESLSRTCEAKAYQWPTYCLNGSPRFYLVATRSARFGIRSRLKEYYSRNT